MGDQKEHPSEEDIPSDFFDDFSKDDFIQGLSVIDSWDEDDKLMKRETNRSQFSSGADDVNDLREVIGGHEAEYTKEEKHHSSSQRNMDNRSSSASRLDGYIQPGSRRDPSKTTEAIRRDKEVKVKEYLAKHLESNDVIKPPGTELDDFFDNRKSLDKKKTFQKFPDKPIPRGFQWNPRHSPPRRSPRRYQQYDRRSPRRSPHRRFSPHRRSPHRRSPHRRSPFRRSPPPRHAWRPSPQRKYKKFIRFSPHKHQTDRFPGRYNSRRSRSRSLEHRDDFLYPKGYNQPSYDTNSGSYQGLHGQQYTAPGTVEYPVDSTSYSYPDSQVYPGYTAAYKYGPQPGPSNVATVPQPVPAPVVAPSLNAAAAPTMVPPPQNIITPGISPSRQLLQVANATSSRDPLAQLVADGKLSHEDYLKLAPNKGLAPVDTQVKYAVLKRCNQAIHDLEKLALPTRLMINPSVIDVEQKTIAPKFCSPLKRQVAVEFHFTRASVSATAHQNKQIVDNIIAAVGLEKILERTKKKVQKNMTDVAVQTNKPFCEMCEIRIRTKCHSVSTCTDLEYFTTSAHTQVDEHDLINSKSVFNPTGSAGNNSAMSIAHLTPAQLVSQLAARAKTLKQTPDFEQQQTQQYNHKNSTGYNNRGSMGHQYHENYSNYRY